MLTPEQIKVAITRIEEQIQWEYEKLERIRQSKLLEETEILEIIAICYNQLEILRGQE